MSGEVKIKVDSLPTVVDEGTIYVIDQPNPNSYTHNYFKYPCKFIPEIPRWAIRAYLGKVIGEQVVLDPFAGSGTTLLESSLMGVPSVGTEIDDIARLIIKVKTTQLSEVQMQVAKSFAHEMINELDANTYNDAQVVLPEINNLNHWFNEKNLRDLGHLYYCIRRVPDADVQDFLLICMASIIKKVSNSDDISPKPYVSNKIKKSPPEVAKTFLYTTCKNLQGMNDMLGMPLATVNVAGDATHIPFKDNSVDIAITSPPYINAFDYVRTLRLENLWLQLSSEDELREKKKHYLGTESIKTKEEKENLDVLGLSNQLKQYFDKIVLVDEKRALILKKFFKDMELNLQEVYRTLKPGGKYIIVIGNSTIRKTDIESWRVLRDIAESVGFKYTTHIGYQILNPYIRIPRGNKGGKIAVDHILVIEK